MDLGDYQLCKLLSGLFLCLSFIMDKMVITITLQDYKDWYNIGLSLILQTFRKRHFELLSLAVVLGWSVGEGDGENKDAVKTAPVCGRKSLFLPHPYWNKIQWTRWYLVPDVVVLGFSDIEAFLREFSWSLAIIGLPRYCFPDGGHLGLDLGLA